MTLKSAVAALIHTRIKPLFSKRNLTMDSNVVKKPEPGDLPPGQRFARRWAIYAALGAPEVNLAEWSLTVDGLVEEPKTYTWEDLQKLTQVTNTRDFQCLVPGSMVYANPEPITIEDVGVRNKVVGSDGMPHQVHKLVTRHYEGSVIGVKPRYLPAVVMTPDHPVRLVRGHVGVGKDRSHRREKTFSQGFKKEWVRADKLKLGDYVYFPKYKHVSNSRYCVSHGLRFPIDEKLAELLGWYVAEGSGSDSDGKNVSFALNTDQLENVERLRVLLEEIFGARVSFYRQNNTLKVNITSSKIVRTAKILKEWCGNNASNKRIPEFIINAKPGVLRAFLTAYLKGDGYYRPWNPNESIGRRVGLIDFTTASKKLAYQLLLALSKLEIAGYIVKHPGSVRTAFSVRVSGAQLRRLIPEYAEPKRVNRNHFWETPEGFYFPIAQLWKEDYSGPVHDFVADGYTMLSPFVTQDCVTGWGIKDVKWEGVSLKELIVASKPKPESQWVMFGCVDGYTAPVPLEDALVDDSIVAFRMNDRPLSREQGFPARPFIPQLYGWKSAKYLNRISLLSEYRDGYWEAYGYHQRANIWEEERFKRQGMKHTPRRGLGTAPI